MSLDLWIIATRPVQVFDGNITHNMGRMARECGLYAPLWEASGKRGVDLIDPLRAGLTELVLHKEKYAKFNPENGWGDIEGLIQFAQGVFNACVQNPDGVVGVSR